MPSDNYVEIVPGAGKLPDKETRLDLSTDFGALKDELARLGEKFAAIPTAVDGAAPSRLSQGMRGVTDSVHEAGSDIAGSARDGAVAFLDELEATVRRNPRGTLIGALGVGIVLGMIARSR